MKVVQVYYGNGKGKTSAAIGQCIRSVSLGHESIIIQFLKGKDSDEFSFLKQFEPEIKLFRFDKEDNSYMSLSEEQKNDENQNILNALNFAKKVIETGGCDVLVLDEVLGLIDLGIISAKDIIHLIQLRDDYTRLVLTGQNLPDELMDYVDVVSKIELIKDNT